MKNFSLNNNNTNTYDFTINPYNLNLKDLKIFLNKMTAHYPLENFIQAVDKQSGGKFTFTQIKSMLDKYYPSSYEEMKSLKKEDKNFSKSMLEGENTTFSKKDKVALLKAFSQTNKNSITTLIPLVNFFKFFEKILEKNLNSPTLCFYYVSEIIEQKKGISTLEFIYKCGCQLNDELNINEFFMKICNNLFLDDFTGITCFKGLDYNKKGKIKIDDFVLVVDSYRDDYLTNPESLIYQDPLKVNNQKNNQHTEGNFNITLKKHAIILKKSIDENFTSIEDLFNKASFLNNNSTRDSNSVKAEDLAEVMMEELASANEDIGIEEFEEKKNNSGSNTNRNLPLIDSGKLIDAINAVLGDLKKINSDGYIDKSDFEGLVNEMTGGLSGRTGNNNFFNQTNTTQTNNFTSNTNLKKLSDSQSYFISKLLVNLEDSKISPTSLFQTCIEHNYNNNNTINNLLPSTVISLETMKRKLKLILPPGKINSMEVNSISESLDFNRNRMVSYKDFMEAFEAVKKASSDNEFFGGMVTGFTGRSVKVVDGGNLPFINNTSTPQNNNSISNSKLNLANTAIGLSKFSGKNTFNSWVKGNKNINFYLLPVRGNYKILNQIKEDIKESNDGVNNYNNIITTKNEFLNKTNGSQFSSKKTGKNNSNNNKSNNNNNNNQLFNQEENLIATEHAPNMNFSGGNRNENDDGGSVKKKKTGKSGGKEEERGLGLKAEMLNFEEETPLINSLESTLIFNKTGLLPSYSLHQELKSKLQPHYHKQEIFDVVKEIDINKCGMISNNNILTFLLNNQKHISTKIAYIEIIRKICVEINSELYSFVCDGLRKHFDGGSSVNNSNNKNKNSNDIESGLKSEEVISMKMLVEYLNEEFEIDRVIGKKIYSDFRTVSKLLYNKSSSGYNNFQQNSSTSSSLKISDFAEFLLDFQDNMGLTAENQNQRQMNKTFNSKQPGSLSNYNYNNNNNMNNENPESNRVRYSEKNFEAAIKSFVSKYSYLESFGHSSRKERVSSIKIFRENIKSSLNFNTQPSILNLYEFKDYFMKPLEIDLNLGMAIFQLIRTFSHKNEQYLKYDDLMMLLESYVEETSSTNDHDYGDAQMLNNIGNLSSFMDSNFSGKAFTSLLEKNGCALKLCFDSINYNKQGFITTLELLLKLKSFYPTISKKILTQGLKILESSSTPFLPQNSSFNNTNHNNSNSNKKNKNFNINNINLNTQGLKGVITYTQLQSFLRENTGKTRFCPILEVYKLASYLDNSRERVSTVDFFSDKGVKNFYSVEFKEHSVIFDFMCVNLETKEEFFIYLSEKSVNQLQILKEQGFKASSYNLIRLIDLVDYYRVNKPGVGEKKGGSQEESSTDYTLNEFATKKLLSIQKLNKINSETKQAISTLLAIHNEEISIDDLISFISMNKKNQISVINLSLLLRKYFSASDSEQKSLMVIMKLLDANKTGVFTYDEMMDILSSILPGFSGSIVLQSKFILNSLLFSETSASERLRNSCDEGRDFEQTFKILEEYFEKQAFEKGVKLISNVGFGVLRSGFFSGDGGNKDKNFSSSDYSLKFHEFEKITSEFFTNTKKLQIKLFNFLVLYSHNKITVNSNNLLGGGNANNSNSNNNNNSNNEINVNECNFFMLNSNSIGKPSISSKTASIESLSFKVFVKFLASSFTFNLGVPTSFITSSLHNPNEIENLTNFSHTNISQLKKDLGLKTAKDEKEFIISYLLHIEKKKIPFKYLFNSINPKKVNQFGRINLENILKIFAEKFNLKNKDPENVVFISFFQDDFNSQQFNLLKLILLIKQYCYISFENSSFKEYRNEFVNKLRYNIKGKINENSYNNNNDNASSLTLEEFLMKFNIKKDFKYNINEVLLLFPSVFKCSFLIVFC